MRGVVAASVVSAVMALPALACESEFLQRSTLDNPLQQNSDGSFEGYHLRAAVRLGDNDDRYSGGYIAGGRVFDVGGSRTGQRVTESSGCTSVEYLLFVDCANGNAVKILGLTDEEYFGGSSGSIALIQAPHGPIALRATTTVEEVEEIAKANNYKYTRDVMADVNKMIRPQRYDPFIGCKIFYPESAGAKM